MKCPHCKKAPFPVWDKENKKINWINIIKTDPFHVIFVIFILVISWFYSHDIEQYETIRTEPQTFCDDYCHSKYFQNTTEDTIYKVPIDFDIESNP